MRFRLLSGLALVGMLCMHLAMAPNATAAASSAGSQITEPITNAGETTLAIDAGAPAGTRQAAGLALGSTRFRGEPRQHEDAGEESPLAAAPSANISNVTQNNPDVIGFEGLSEFDQLVAGTGKYANSQLELEPPDQGLCVGGNYVIESVNVALQVYTKQGAAIGRTVPLNQFFHLAPEFDPATGLYGDFLSDPKCYYDVAAARWFMSILQIDLNPKTGDFGKHSHLLFAVSRSDDPTKNWQLFKIDTTNDGTRGTPKHPGCPCLGDQPLIGADKYGFYLSTAEYSITGPAFNGPQIYAISKSALAHGSPAQAVVFSDLGRDSGSVQPATSPTTKFETSNGGVEYFVSGFDTLPDGNLRPGPDHRIRIWGLTNTQSLDSKQPELSLTNDVLSSEVYSQPPPVLQKSGPIPLRDCLARKACAQQLGLKKASNEKLDKLESNDDRMNQVVFANGLLWSAINTAVRQSDDEVHAGIAYFVIRPRIDGDQVDGRIVRQGYVSVYRSNVIFPSIGVNDQGAGAMVFTLSDRLRFPSAAFAPIDAHGAGTVHIIAPGLGPSDGFSGYKAFGGKGVARWGDYSAAVADTDGNIWIATEYIAQICTFSQFLADPSCGGTRGVLANWSTFVARVTP